jgi:hypothetical protein
MASHGVYLAACGFEYDGPKGHLGFAPRLTPDNFRAAFTAAEGWGTFSQKKEDGGLSVEVSVKWGRLRLKTLALEFIAPRPTERVRVTLGRKAVTAGFQQEGSRVRVGLKSATVLLPGHPLVVTIG